MRRLALALALVGCAPEPEIREASGEAFGTRWTVRARGPGPDLASLVPPALERVDEAMSNWRDDSELSRLNRSDPGPQPVSLELATVLAAAIRIHEESGGAFDVTVAPLLALWGFGPGGPRDAPAGAEIEDAMARTGSGRLALLGTTLARDRPGVEIDLSAIAKGYAADLVHEALVAGGSAEHLVEIGGDLRILGAWRIGVENPGPALAPGVARSFRLRDGGVATSGGYRDFREEDGGFLTHVLDPRIGRPVPRRSGSVTVFAPTALEADAWATALFALGPVDGAALAERRGLAALFLTAGPDGEIEERTTAAWRGSLR